MVLYGPIEHRRVVLRIADQVRGFYERKEHFRLYHGHTNSTRSVHRSPETVIDTSALSHVIRFDPQQKTVEVEPNVDMDALLEATLKRGFLPLVVPEFRGITVGGAFAGTAGESSSYKYGLFDSTVARIEIILADGTITNASEAESLDLLRGSSGACGTLGVVTLLKLRLIEAKSFVRLTYQPITSTADAVASMKRLDADPNIDLIDGILFSATVGVIMSGTMCGEAGSTDVQRFTRPWDEHFYTHAKKCLGSSRDPWTEYIPVRDYFFRYDRGCFWGAERAFEYFHVPFNRITRWLLDSFMASKVMFHAMHESGLASKAIIQDIAVPIDLTPHFVKWQDDELQCYPLWLCPLRAVGQDVNPSSDSRPFGAGCKAGLRDLYCNIGIWIMAPSMTMEAFVALNRKIEKAITNLGGLKTLYAHSYYTEDEFWSIYDRPSYQQLRQKYNAESLIDVWEKVTVKARSSTAATVRINSPIGQLAFWLKETLKERWPFRGLYGVWKVLTSPVLVAQVYSGSQDRQSCEQCKSRIPGSSHLWNKTEYIASTSQYEKAELQRSSCVSAPPSAHY